MPCVFLLKPISKRLCHIWFVRSCHSYSHIIKIVMVYIYRIKRQRENSSNIIVIFITNTISSTIMINAAIFQITMNEIIHLLFSTRKAVLFFEIGKKFNNQLWCICHHYTLHSKLYFWLFGSGTLPFLIASIESWTALRIAFAYSPLAIAFGAFIPNIISISPILKVYKIISTTFVLSAKVRLLIVITKCFWRKSGLHRSFLIELADNILYLIHIHIHRQGIDG